MLTFTHICYFVLFLKFLNLFYTENETCTIDKTFKTDIIQLKNDMILLKDVYMCNWMAKQREANIKKSKEMIIRVSKLNVADIMKG